MENNIMSMEKQFELLEQGVLEAPHSILGLHSDKQEEKQVVRVFCPGGLNLSSFCICPSALLFL